MPHRGLQPIVTKHGLFHEPSLASCFRACAAPRRLGPNRTRSSGRSRLRAGPLRVHCRSLGRAWCPRSQRAALGGTVRRRIFCRTAACRGIGALADSTVTDAVLRAGPGTGGPLNRATRFCSLLERTQQHG